MKRLLFIFIILCSLTVSGFAYAQTTTPTITNTVNAEGEVTQMFCGVGLLSGQKVSSDVQLPDAATCNESADKTLVITKNTTQSKAQTQSNVSGKTGYSAMSLDIPYWQGRFLTTESTGLNGVWGSFDATVPTFNPTCGPSNCLYNSFFEVHASPGGYSCLNAYEQHNRKDNFGNASDYLWLDAAECGQGAAGFDLNNGSSRSKWTAPWGTSSVMTYMIVNTSGAPTCFTGYVYNYSTGAWDYFINSCGLGQYNGGKGEVYFWAELDAGYSYCPSILPHRKVINLKHYKLGAWRAPTAVAMPPSTHNNTICSGYWSRSDSFDSIGYQGELVTTP